MTKPGQRHRDTSPAGEEPLPGTPAAHVKGGCTPSGQDYFHLAQRISDENVWHWDLARGALHWSPRIAALLGIDKDICVLSGDPFQTFAHPDDLPRAAAAIQAHLKKGTPYRVEERLMTKAGTYIWFLVRGKAVRNKEGRPLHMTGYITDINRLKQEALDREKELVETRDLAKEMAVINELSRTLTTRLTVEEVVQETYRQASRLIDTRNFAMSLYNPEKGEHEFVLNITESELDKEALTRLPANLGISGYIIHNRTPVLIKENAIQWMSRLGVQPVGDPAALSWLGVPLLLGNQVLGVIIVQNHHRERVYDEHDRDLLMTIASSAAVALQNARLFSEKHQSELEAAERSERIKSRLTPVLDSLERIEFLSRPAGSESADPDLQEIFQQASRIKRELTEVLSLVPPPSLG